LISYFSAGVKGKNVKKCEAGKNGKGSRKGRGKKPE
jgi:hypothetical protein